MATTKKDVESKEVKLPALEIRRLEVRVRGVTPLIVNAFSAKAKQQMADKQQKKAKLAKEAKDPVELFNAARYVIDGKDAVSAITIKKSVMTAAVFGDEMKTRVGMSLFVRGNLANGDYVEILGPKPRMREDVVRVGTMTKTADLRYRPEYTNWKLKFVVEFNNRVLTAEQVLNLVSIAGFSCGICEWRPQKGGGDYGRFELDMKDVKTAGPDDVADVTDKAAE